MQAQASSGLTCLWCLEYSDYFEVNHFKFCLQKGILPPVCNLLLELSLLAWFYHFALSCPKWSVSCSVVSDSCDPMDCSLPGSSVHGILQARIQEWVAISSSRGLNLGLLHCRQTLYHLSHKGSILLTTFSYEWKLCLYQTKMVISMLAKYFYVSIIVIFTFPCLFNYRSHDHVGLFVSEG